MSTADMTPALSRRTVTPLMASRGLRPAAQLAAGKPCGTRVRYYAGCRCHECRAANKAYEHQRAEARARGEGNGLVSAERARAHLQWLSARGVGRKTAADAAKVSLSVVAHIASGRKQTIRAQTERRLLQVTEAAAADRACIDATQTWQRLDELIACGYSRAYIASQVIGHPAKALQLVRHSVTARNAERVRQAYERLRYATPAETRQALKLQRDLRAEGYRPERVLAALTAEATRRGWAPPTLETARRGARAGCLRHQEVLLLVQVHRELTGADFDTQEAA